MEYNEDRYSLRDIPTFTLPPPPRFDAATSAAARPVEPLADTQGFASVRLFPRISRLIRRRSKPLALMAIVGLATGAAGGMLVVERDRQQRFTTSSTSPLINALAESLEAATPVVDQVAPASLEPSAKPVLAQPNRRRSRRAPRRELVVLSNENADQDQDEGYDEEEDKDEEADDRRKDRERHRNRKDKDQNADSDRSDRLRRGGTMLYDVLRTRRP